MHLAQVLLQVSMCIVAEGVVNRELTGLIARAGECPAEGGGRKRHGACRQEKERPFRCS